MEVDPQEESALVRKITWRIIPLLCVLFFLAFLERVNLSNAHDALVKDLHLSEKDYALAVGVFFVGYVVFEIPSNILLVKTSPSRWIARIMVTWGVISMLQVFVKDMTGLVVVRFFFGIAEAGFTPAVIFYLTLWFTKHEQAGRMAIFFSSTTYSGLFGGLLAYGILQMEGLLGLHGWQWLFLIEGFPSLVFGVIVWFYLPDSPATCKFLTEKERDLATRRLEGAGADQHVVRLHDVVATLRDWRVLGCGFVYFTIVTAFYGITFFLPALMTDFGFTTLTANLMTTPVYLFSAIVMLTNAWHSDKTQERKWHIVGPGIVSIASWGVLACACALKIYALELAASFFVTAFTWATISPTLVWLMSGLNGATSSAVGAATVNSIGNIGGIAGPYILGASMDGRGNYDLGMAAAGALLAVGMGIMLVMQKYRNPNKQEVEGSDLLYISLRKSQQDYTAE